MEPVGEAEAQAARWRSVSQTRDIHPGAYRCTRLRPQMRSGRRCTDYPIDMRVVRTA